VIERSLLDMAHWSGNARAKLRQKHGGLRFRSAITF